MTDRRQPRGLPVGGQFAASARSEADVVAPTEDPYGEQGVDFGAALPSSIRVSRFGDCQISQTVVAVPLELSEGKNRSDTAQRAAGLSRVLAENYPQARLHGENGRLTISWEHQHDASLSFPQVHADVWSDKDGPAAFARDARGESERSVHTLLREGMLKSSMTAAPSARELRTPQLSAGLNAARNAWRSGIEPGPPIDDNARFCARILASSGPQMRHLADHGFCDYERAMAEIETDADGDGDEAFARQQVRQWLAESNSRLRARWS